MSKPYDVTSKDLIEAAPADWVAFFGRPVDPAKVRVIDADVSAVSAAADKVIRVEDDPPWILHLEFQASSETGLPRRWLRYNALLHERHGCPVATAVVLLRKEANASDVTGEWAIAAPVGPGWAFRYQVLRVWESPVEPLLTGGLGLLPLAPIAAVPPGDLPAVVNRLRSRLGSEATRGMEARLWTGTYILLGLKYEDAFIAALLEGVLQMEESTTYQAILRRGLKEGRAQGEAEGRVIGEVKGRATEARELLLRLGTKKFGPPPADVVAEIAAIGEAEPLERLVERVLDVASWPELMAGR